MTPWSHLIPYSVLNNSTRSKGEAHLPRAPSCWGTPAPAAPRPPPG
jgi:hypothetical protein